MSDGKELYKFRTGSGIVSNPISFEHNGKQFVAVLTGVGGWPIVGQGPDGTIFRPWSCEFCRFNPYDRAIANHTALGGNLVVFALPDDVIAKTAKPK